MTGDDSTVVSPAFLSRVPLFSGLTAAELAVVSQAARPMAFGQDAYFFHQGDQADSCYLLTAGRVRLSQVTPEGDQVIMRFFGPGESFAFGATLSQTPYPLSAEAVDPCHALAWDRRTITGLMERYPRLALNAVNLLVEQVRELQDRYRELATERVERRIARAVLRLARQAGRKTQAGVLIDLALSRQDLAEMTGTTLYTVSRILSQWEEKGLVETGRERILVKSPHGLVGIAEDLPPRQPPARS